MRPEELHGRARCLHDGKVADSHRADEGGLPGAPEGMKKDSPTIAALPTAHGFDEFLGNRSHLNAEEEPENSDYPKSAEFKKKFGPRGVIHRFGDGCITGSGPLTRKRMETIASGCVLGYRDDIDRPFSERNFATTTGMVLLAAAEIGGFALLFGCFLATQLS